eukprot:120910_1
MKLFPIPLNTFIKSYDMLASREIKPPPEFISFSISTCPIQIWSRRSQLIKEVQWRFLTKYDRLNFDCRFSYRMGEIMVWQVVKNGMSRSQASNFSDDIINISG